MVPLEDTDRRECHLALVVFNYNLESVCLCVTLVADNCSPLLFVPHSKVESDTSILARIQLQDSLVPLPSGDSRYSISFEICQINSLETLLTEPHI